LTLATLRFYEAYKAQFYAKKKYFVLVDRWPTNQLGKMDGPKIIVDSTSNRLIKWASKIERIIYTLMPKADVCFFMEVSVETAVKRNSMRIKHDKESESEIRFRHSQNNKIRPSVKKLIIFDNNGDIDLKRHELLMLIRNELAEECVLNTLQKGVE
jgi:thymidylate kinase